MPVRVKQRPMKDGDCKLREREWGLLRKIITGTLLAWGSPVSLTMEGTDKDQKLHFQSPWPFSIRNCGRTSTGNPYKSFDTDLIRSTLHQGAGVELSSWGAWVKTSARTPFMTIRGLISLEAAPSKDTQFITLGCCYLRPGDGCYSLYEAVNRLFGLSSFGVQEEEDGRDTAAKIKIEHRSKPNQVTTSELRGGGKGVDRWPKYFIRIEPNAETSPNLMEDLGSAEHRTKLSSIIKVLEVMITSFLTEHCFRPRKHRSRKRVEIGSSPQRQKSVKLSLPLQHSTNISCIKASDEHSMSKGCLTETTPAAFGDLGAHVKIPSFSQNGDSVMKDILSGWSRIKGLSRENSSARAQKGSLPKSPLSEFSPVSQYGVASETQHNSILLDSSEGDGSRPLPMTIGPTTSMSGFVGAQAGLGFDYEGEIENLAEHIVGADCAPEIHGQSDCTVAWKNPVTQTMVKINARTGSVIADKPRDHGSNSVAASSIETVGPQTTRLRMTRASNLQNITGPFSAPAEGSWAKGFLDTWDNPIFRRTEEQISQVSLQFLENTATYNTHCKSRCFATGIEARASADASSFGAATFTINGLESAKVVAQVDKKFILIKLATSLPQQGMDKPKQCIHQTLVLVDQHAADERIRIESLLAELCATATPRSRHLKSSLGFCSAIETTKLLDSIRFAISAQDHGLFKESASRFARWGILYDLPQSLRHGSNSESNHAYQMIILTLPGLIAERCRSDPKHLLRILREDIWRRKEGGISQTDHANLPLNHISNSSAVASSARRLDKTWPCSIRDCPQGILDMLNSRSCRSAIMFNDVLTHESCIRLIKNLATCMFPFQCAHGRPSMVPLVNIDNTGGYEHRGLATRTIRSAEGQELNFREAWRRSRQC